MRKIITNVGKTTYTKSIDINLKENISSKELFKRIRNKSNNEINNISPEINSLNHFKLEKNDELIFISTNDEIVIKSAEALSEYFKMNGFKVAIKIIESLKDNTEKSFREGITEYVNYLIDIFDYAINNYFELCVNVTSGYKSLIPYSTILAAVYNQKVFYLFENSSIVNTLIPFPIDLNYEIIKKYDLFFEKMRINDFMKEEEILKYINYNDLHEMLEPIYIEKYEEECYNITPLANILIRKFDIEHPLIYLNKRIEEKLKQYKKDIVDSIRKFLEGAGERNHSLRNYDGKENCFKGFRNWRMFYIIKDKRLYVSDFFGHSEYDNYVDFKKENKIILSDFTPYRLTSKGVEKVEN